MQRVVRSSLMGLLAIAGLTACGDKVTIPPTQTVLPTAVVHSVTVSPASATLNTGDKITLAASVNADAGVTDRTVTWTSANTAIASVDANGVVTAGTAGNTTVTAASKADPNVKGAALITVTAGPGVGAPATVTISTINQTVCVVGGGCNSVPANLGNVTGQIDVTMNVDPGAQRLVGVDLVMNCSGNGNSGADTVVATQTLASANVAVDAAASAAPVTLSFNTASFNSTSGAVAFRNAACTIKGRARTNAVAGGTITTVTSTGSAITLNNTDVVIGTQTAAKTAINPVTGLVWSGGANVTITATPVMYSGRVPATIGITYEGVVTSTAGAGPATVVFNNGLGATATNNIVGKTDVAAAPTFTLIDSQGNAFTSNPCGTALCQGNSVLAGAPVAIATIRLDTQKPQAGNFLLAGNPQGTLTSWVGAGFRFVADSASGFAGPDSTTAVVAPAVACAGVTGATGSALASAQRVCNRDSVATSTAPGVGGVTVAFVTTNQTLSSITATVTSAAPLAETVSNTSNTLAMITTDALGNADTSFSTTLAGARLNTASRFGVDKTAPANTLTGTANQTTAQAIGGAASIITAITDGLSGPAASQLVAQVILNNTVNSASPLPANQTIGTITAPGSNNGGCIVGRFNRTSGAANADTLALPVFDKTGAQIGTCSPTAVPLTGGTSVLANVAAVAGYTTTRIVAVDQAGNRSAPQTIQAVEDATPPTVGALDLPTSATGGATLTVPAQVFDAIDVVGTAVQINYAATNLGGNPLQYAQNAGPGTAFDNVLTPGSASTAATASSSIAFFARNLQNAPAAARPSTPVAANLPGNIAVGAVDEVNFAAIGTPVALTTTTTVALPSSNPWASDFLNGTTISANNLTVSNCPAAGCPGGPPSPAPVNPTSTTFTVTAQGTTGTFANPFSTVQVWYQVAGAGPWFLAGTTGAGSSRDTGVGGFRFWDFTLVFTPPKTAQRNVATGVAASLTGGTTLQVIGIGFTANGDGVVTPAITLTLTGT